MKLLTKNYMFCGPPEHLKLLPAGSEERVVLGVGIFPLVEIWKSLRYNCININIVTLLK